ncbi:MAG: hypothetical protein ACRDGL_02345 [Candidatus Limnocylindrales bacterium]
MATPTVGVTNTEAPTASASPTESPLSTPAPTPTEEPQPTDVPTPPPAHPAGWSISAPVMTAIACETIDLLVDGSDGAHVVTECDGLIQYAASHGTAGWSTVTFGRAGGVVDRNPRLALDGQRLYAGYSQAVAQGGCGGEHFTQVGVYIRSRLLPGGAWSAATRVGPIGDQLESLAVHAGTLVLAVASLDGKAYLETVAGGILQRYPYGGSAASVAVTPNGDVGLAYVTESGGLRYATLGGSRLTSTTVPGVPTEGGIVSDPQLAFDASGHPHLAFAFTSAGGCVVGESQLHGTYYATKASGAWIDRRMAPLFGQTGLALDRGNGGVDILVDGGSESSRYGSVSLYTSKDGRSWARTELVSQALFDSALALDPTSGRPVVAVVEPLGDSQTGQVFLFTQR